jgi:small subunit ribosomal protein S6
MLILPPDADDKVIGGATDRIAQILAERGGGEIVKVDRWGRRRFSYEINRQAEGFYVVVECQADPTAIAELDRVLTLADEVIRFKVVVRAA